MYTSALPKAANTLTVERDRSSVASRRSRSRSPRTLPATTQRRSRWRPRRTTWEGGAPVTRSERLEVAAGLPSTDRLGSPLAASSRSARTRASYACPTRCENSSVESRPASRCSLSEAAARSRSSSDTRSPGSLTPEACHSAGEQVASGGLARCSARLVEQQLFAVRFAHARVAEPDLLEHAPRR